MNTCKVVENSVKCEGEAKQQGLCYKHYQRERRYGDVFIKHKTGRPRAKICPHCGTETQNRVLKAKNER